MITRNRIGFFGLTALMGLSFADGAVASDDTFRCIAVLSYQEDNVGYSALVLPWGSERAFDDAATPTCGDTGFCSGSGNPNDMVLVRSSNDFIEYSGLLYRHLDAQGVTHRETSTRLAILKPTPIEFVAGALDGQSATANVYTIFRGTLQRPLSDMKVNGGPASQLRVTCGINITPANWATRVIRSATYNPDTGFTSVPIPE